MSRGWFGEQYEREPIPLVPTEKAYTLPADLAAVTVGDTVRVGIGAAAWTVTALEPWGDTVLARVQRGGITARVRADRLTVVRTP